MPTNKEIIFCCVNCETKLNPKSAVVVGGPYDYGFDALENTLWTCQECGETHDDFFFDYVDGAGND